MSDIILKDENIESSPSIVGYRMLDFMKRKGLSKVSVFDVADNFKKEKWFNAKNLYFAMMFLYSLDLIEFNNSYITRTSA